MSLLMGPSAKQLESILSELGEHEGLLNDNIQDLKNWIRNQPHLPNDIDDHLLTLYLRGCKHNRMRCRSKLEQLMVARASYTSLYADRDYNTTHMQTVIKIIDVVALPRMTEDGCRVTVFRIKPRDHDATLNTTDAVKFIFTMVDLRLREEHPISGDIFIWDLGGARGQDATRVTSPSVRSALQLATRAYPQRLRRLHLLNAPVFLHAAIALLRSFANEKIRKRFISHQTIESLHEHVPRAILPRDYNGDEISIAELSQQWCEKYRDSRQYLDSMADMKACGIRDRTYDTGMEGSFRKLDID